MISGMIIAIGLAFFLFVGSRLFGFLGQKPQHYAHEAPLFDIREILNGEIHCEGVIFGPFGRVSSRFTAKMFAEWDGDRGKMSEDFSFHKGGTLKREWSLALTPDGKIIATASDIIGEGIGEQSGSAVSLRYRLKLSREAGGYVLSVTDWMYLLENGTIINRSQMRKFGIKVAELVAVMRKMS